MSSASALRSSTVQHPRPSLFPDKQGASSSTTSHSRNANGQQTVYSVRSKVPSSKRCITPNSRTHCLDENQDSQRVRVAVLLRPKNYEELAADSDFVDCIELQPELKRLKLRKNNWTSESYRFDEVFTETASQKRVYEAVAKPVVESVLNGYNGTVMAYGQTGTGKTYTVGRLGKDDASERGIMVRAVEEIIANTSASDIVEISYIQLYMESVQDLLAPEKVNISIHEDPKTGEVALPGVEVVKVRDHDSFLKLLQVGEANRYASNTKMNTESSRSHAVLIVYIQRSVRDKAEYLISQGADTEGDHFTGNGKPMIRKSKLLIVDLAGSERIDKSGSEGHMLEEAKFINLSLTSLGKCINALAENIQHIPTRDSKLTRLLRDSFGGSSRTSLIITIGPSAKHHSETASTIMFGQRAMKITNMVKFKEEVDYESLCWQLEKQVDHLTAEIERKQKLREDEKHQLKKQLKECQDGLLEEEILRTKSEFLEKENHRLEAEVRDIQEELKHHMELTKLMHEKVEFLEASLRQSEQIQHESSTYQKILADTTQMYENKITDMVKQIEEKHAYAEAADQELSKIKNLLNHHQNSNKQLALDNSALQKTIADTIKMYEEKIRELVQQVKVEHARYEGETEQLNLAKVLLIEHKNSLQVQNAANELEEKLQVIQQKYKAARSELESLELQCHDLLVEKATMNEEIHVLRGEILSEEKYRKDIESKILDLKKNVPEIVNDIEEKRSFIKDNIEKYTGNETPSVLLKYKLSRETISSHRATIAKICEEVGLQKIFKLMESEDSDVQMHAVKVVANLAAEDVNQLRIVEEGGLDPLIGLLRSSQNTNILGLASGAIANLAMHELNQGLIMSKEGAKLLARIASRTEDPQTLRMVAGALANLCGNETLHTMLKEDGALKALFQMVNSGNHDVTAQVARALANFAKCESRGIRQGHRQGPSLLIDEGALNWLVENLNTSSDSIRRHIELTLCHLAQNEDNTKDFMSTGAYKELIRISMESKREDIRNLATKTLRVNPVFKRN